MRVVDPVNYSYPYANTFISEEQAANMLIEALVQANDALSTSTSNLREERISGYFVDQVRTLCRRSDESMPPYQYFINNAANIYQEANDSPEIADNIIWKDIKGCGAFRPSILMSFIDKYKPKSILDPCAGWGDRLLAALSKRIIYTGVDPNKLLHYHYQQMIEAFQLTGKSTITSKVNMIEAPFEDAVIEDDYDMIFTSPPFADLEIYGKGAGQSSNTGNLREWKTKFFYPLLQKSWNHLKQGGIMCLHMSMSFKYSSGQWGGNSDYIKDMIAYMKNHTDVAKYEKIATSTKVPIYTWTKDIKESTDEFYPSIIITDGIFDLSGINLKARAIAAYLRTISGPVSYIAADDDITAIALSTSKKVTLSVPNASQWLLEQLDNSVADIIDYKPSTTAQLLPKGLDTPEFESLMVAALKRDLPYIGDTMELITPQRVWLSVVTGVTLRALGTVWRNTLFLASCQISFDATILPLQLRRRVSVYVNSNNKSLKKMRTQYGYPSDLILDS
jgi:16S rRNA G966 N2-methylase RsmD